MQLHEKVVLCQNCPRSTRVSNVQWACGISGRPLAEHAGTDYCPHDDGPRYGTDVKPAGWNDLPLPPPLQVQEIPANFDGNYQNDSKGTEPCNC